MIPIERRSFITGAAAALAASTMPAFANIPGAAAKTLAFNNIHTGERLTIDYWVEGRYLPDALQSINHLLRDFRTGEVHPIEPRLMDLLTALRTNLETTEPFEVISGYRSPTTNASLRAEREHSGVAAKSLHMQGMAIDIRIPGRALEALRSAALTQRAGGVGYYPQSDFVHVDVGRVRIW
jgi:uncharacterized protein YcbK (DUF882 family)